MNLLSPEDARYWETRGYSVTPDNEPRDFLARPRLAPILDGLTCVGGRAVPLC